MRWLFSFALTDLCGRHCFTNYKWGTCWIMNNSFPLSTISDEVAENIIILFWFSFTVFYPLQSVYNVLLLSKIIFELIGLSTVLTWTRVHLLSAWTTHIPLTHNVKRKWRTNTLTETITRIYAHRHTVSRTWIQRHKLTNKPYTNALWDPQIQTHIRQTHRKVCTDKYICTQTQTGIHTPLRHAFSFCLLKPITSPLLTTEHCTIQWTNLVPFSYDPTWG